MNYTEVLTQAIAHEEEQIVQFSQVLEINTEELTTDLDYFLKEKDYNGIRSLIDKVEDGQREIDARTSRVEYYKRELKKLN